MAGRGLVIGAVVGQVQGVENDVQAVTAFLAERGFSVTTLDPRSEATRDAILHSYRKLIDAVEPGSDEPVVIYYAGHGGIVVNRDAGSAGLPRMFQCIIPIDYAAGTETDFRGITSFELSALQHQLTARTRNVTVILDCCYSGQMSRAASDDAPRPRSLRAPTPLAMRRHLAQLRARYPDLFSQPVIGNPTAVRVMACGEQETAWPIRDAQGQWYGVFTLALLDVLRDLGDTPPAWSAVGNAVSARVRSSYPNQQPRIEGPQHRRIFSLLEETAMAIAIQRTGATFTLEAGTLAGVAVGDVYAAIDRGDPDRELARLRVTSVTPLAARAEPVPGSRAGAVPRAAVAVPRTSARPRRPVAVRAPPDVAERIEGALAGTRRLRRATQADTSIAWLTVDASGLRLLDVTGPVMPPASLAELPSALEIGDRLAAARDLLDLEGAHGIAPEELEIEWGIVEDGVAFTQPPHGTVVDLEAKVFLRVKNVGSRELVVHALNVGVLGHITLLSRAAPRGMHLAPRQQICLGSAPDEQQIIGLDVGWPPGLPRDKARLDTLLVIATTRDADFRALESAVSTGAPPARSIPRGALPPAPPAEPSGSPPPAIWLRRSLRAAIHDRNRAADDASRSDPYLMTSITYFIDPKLQCPWMHSRR